MAIRRIIKEGDPILRAKCRPVTQFDEKLHQLLDDMHETLDQADGVGLAAPQVGYCRRFFIMHLGDVRIEAINPEILKTSGRQRVLEGCLSVPNCWGYVKRPNKCEFRAQDRNGAWFQMTLTALGAQCITHEYAHLDGQLFIDVVEEFVDPKDLEEA
ncbi:MAG: peptide deformylase [Ruminococcus sp.]|nr:peptide deformylase [Ruminococcus sp.]